MFLGLFYTQALHKKINQFSFSPTRECRTKIKDEIDMDNNTTSNIDTREHRSIRKSRRT